MLDDRLNLSTHIPLERRVRQRLRGLGFSKASPVAAGALIMVLEGAAIFMNGAYFLGPMTLFVVAAWMLLAVLLLTSPAGMLLRRENIIPLALITCLWLWTGLSFTWSIAPDLSWNEFNRTGGYVAIFAIACIIGRYRLARAVGIWMFFIVLAVAMFYSLGVKALPGEVNNIEEIARTSVPLGYANALGALLALGFPLAVYFTAARSHGWLTRLFSAMMAPLLLVGFFFTLSRGAMLALVVGMAVYFIAVPLRLRSFGVLILSLLPASIVCWWANDQPALAQDKIDLVQRMQVAAQLRLYLAALPAVAGFIMLLALLIGKKVTFPARLTHLAGGSVLTVLTISAMAGCGWFVSSQPSFSGWVTQTYREFTTVRETPIGAARLLNVGSSVRWRLWQEAIANWRQHELTGTGAQSFPLTHLIVRESDMPFVKQPHGLPFRLLSELGLVGFLLGGSFIFIVIGFGVRNLLRLRDRWERGMMGALLALVVIYLVHTTYDWDWNMFALTMPFFFFSGILVSWPRGTSGDAEVEINGVKQDDGRKRENGDGSGCLPDRLY